MNGLAREYVYLTTILRTLWALRKVKPDARRTIVDIVEGHARRTPHAPAVFYLDQVMDYAALNARANRYANWAIAQGIKPGDPVGLLMENRPDFICAWLGLFKAGAAAALVNTNQRGAALVHSLEAVGVKHLIAGAELAQCFEDAKSLFTAPPRMWVQGQAAVQEPVQWTGESGERRELGRAAGYGDLDTELARVGDASPPKSARAATVGKSRAFYIYTSGTTGLPKAANFSHMRMLFMMTGFVGALKPTARDRIYDPLPLYHATGGVCAVGMAFMVGGALVIKRKFSLNEFWSDIHKYDATIFAYIGELCRWLLNAPPGIHEQDHKLRAITGNGLRAEIWESFQKRFNIPRVVEFYGATEGNVSMLNYDGTVGAVGRVPEYMEWVLPTRVVRFDVESEMPVRAPDGLCIECGPTEAGEAVGGISQRAGRNFEGYTRPGETEKKILRDVFKRGDAWFRTGDLMRRDAHGYFYFVDRIGDTFRWKGENVATSEVSEALSAVPGVKEANVYGVKVPGHDGRAGMAALVVDAGFDMAGLAARLDGRLPHFARPLFLRLAPETDVTATFKQKKVELVREGFDPAAIADPVYWLNPATGHYEWLDATRYAALITDQIKI